jgi:DNA-binding HxlR family transcriptional regulator
MRSKPHKKGRHKKRSISALLPHSEHILLSLLEGNNNINGIFRILNQTGYSYKPDVLDSIDYLEKGKFISKNVHPEHSLKIVTSLTDLGKNIAHLILNIEKYIESLAKLDEAINSNLDVKLPKEINEIDDSRLGREMYDILPVVERKVNHNLKNKGWIENERAVFLRDGFRVPHGIRYLLDESPKLIFNILLQKYRELLKYSVNETSRAIIEGIIIKMITRVLQCVDTKHLYSSVNNQTNPDDMCQSVFDYIAGVSGLGALVYTCMNENVMQVFESLVSIAEPRREHFKKMIPSTINGLKELLSDTSLLEGLDSVEIFREQSLSRLLPFYQKIAKKWG